MPTINKVSFPEREEPINVNDIQIDSFDTNNS